MAEFENKAEELAYMRKNKSLIIARKTNGIIKGEAVSYAIGRVNEKGETIKATAENIEDLLESDTLKVEVVINTTNIQDSHRDVHIKGIWDKSIKEQKILYLLQEHKMEFDKIISDEVKAVLRNYKWVDLGYPYNGKTQALVFKATIRKDRNPYMFEQYAKGYVKNHSVGMRYMKLALASPDERYPDEVAIWDKYINQIANKEDVEEIGYFWAIIEAKIIEGSAVPLGSNSATPTLTVSSKSSEPLEDTHEDEPPSGTQNGATKRSALKYY